MDKPERCSRGTPSRDGQEYESGPWFYGNPSPWPYSAWLIETGSPARYWHSGGRNGSGYNETWVDDAHNALKFRSEEFARLEVERIKGFGVKVPMRVCGHTFNCGTSAEPSPKPLPARLLARAKAWRDLHEIATRIGVFPLDAMMIDAKLHEEAAEAVARSESTEAKPLSEWHEDTGNVTWWAFPVMEPPWIGTPGDSDWPGHHTHWTPLPPIPKAPKP